MDATDPTVAKEQFTALYGSYARTHERFVENAYKTTTLTLVILGWGLSSESARSFLRSDHTVLALCFALIALGALSILVSFRRMVKLSNSIRDKLDQLAYLGSSFYEQHAIPPSLSVAVIGQNLLICTLIEILLLRLY